MARIRTLSELPAFDTDSGMIRAVIETPKGSANKYDYDPEYGCFELAKTLPQGMTLPFDFGFIPSTKGEDGDPLDVLILMDFPGIAGCIVKAGLIGCIQAEQKEKGKKAVRNDRFIAVAEDSRTWSGVKALSDLRSGFMKEIKEFFVQYNKLAGKQFTPLGDCNAANALNLVKQGVKKVGKKR